jgi:hypothetical protein
MHQLTGACCRSSCGNGSLKVDAMQNASANIHRNSSGDISLHGDLQQLQVDASGSGDLDIDSSQLPLANIQLNGSGDLILRGHIAVLNLNLRGSGEVKASQLSADDVRIESHGSGDLRFNSIRQSLKQTCPAQAICIPRWTMRCSLS